jgi:hypothetical protein
LAETACEAGVPDFRAAGEAHLAACVKVDAREKVLA